MTKKCEGHNVWMPEKQSKTKFNEDGSPKLYFGHMYEGKMCFGIEKNNDPEEQMEKYVKDLDAEKKHEAQQTLDNIAMEETKKFAEEAKNDYTRSIVEDKPMTRLDWNIKEFIKGLGVFSAAARQEGMPPKEAFENMAIWDWMDVAYGDMPGYEDWKEKAKKRIK